MYTEVNLAYGISKFSPLYVNFGLRKIETLEPFPHISQANLLQKLKPLKI